MADAAAVATETEVQAAEDIAEEAEEAAEIPEGWTIDADGLPNSQPERIRRSTRVLGRLLVSCSLLLFRHRQLPFPPCRSVSCSSLFLCFLFHVLFVF